MERIKDILRENQGEYFTYQIYYRASKRDRPGSYIFIGDDTGPTFGYNRDDVELLDLWAYDWDLFDKDSYYYHVDPDSRGYDDDWFEEGGNVLIIWLSNLSYDILSDPSIQKVDSIRMSNLGAFQQMLVLRDIKQNSHHYNDSFDDFDDCDGDDCEEYDDNYYDCEYVDPCLYELVEGSPKRLGQLFARESCLVDEEKFNRSFGKFIECPEDADWWTNETFEEHFEMSDAKILVVILA